MSRHFRKFIFYSMKAEYVFLHQNWYFDFLRFLFTPISIKKKYIWCVWGHDLHTNYGRLTGIKEKIKLILKNIGSFLINYEIKYYKGIGIGFKYDALAIKRDL